MKTYIFKHTEIFAEIKIDASNETEALEVLEVLVKDSNEWELV